MYRVALEAKLQQHRQHISYNRGPRGGAAPSQPLASPWRIPILRWACVPKIRYSKAIGDVFQIFKFQTKVSANTTCVKAFNVMKIVRKKEKRHVFVGNITVGKCGCRKTNPRVLLVVHGLSPIRNISPRHPRLLYGRGKSGKMNVRFATTVEYREQRRSVSPTTKFADISALLFLSFSVTFTTRSLLTKKSYKNGWNFKIPTHFVYSRQ